MPRWSRRSFVQSMAQIAGALWQKPSLARALARSLPGGRQQAPETNTLWYRAPAREWTDALPVGNGRLGGVIFGDPKFERILLNQESFWSGKPRPIRPPNPATYLPMLRDLLIDQDGPGADQVVRERFLSKLGESYQPLGFLELRHEAASDKTLTGYRRSLDLRSGIHTVTCTDAQGSTREERIFASAPDQVLAVRLTSSRPGALHFTAKLGSTMRDPTYSAEQGVLRMEVRAPAHVIKADVDNANAAITWDSAKGEEPVRATVAMCVLSAGPEGSCSISKDGIRIAGATSVTLLVSAATSYTGPYTQPNGDSSAPALLALQRARQISDPDTLEKRHIDDHTFIFDRAHLEFSEDSGLDLSALPTDERLLRAAAGGNDPALAALYFRMGRYLLMASSRPGSLPATTGGIWSHRMRPPEQSHWAFNGEFESTYALAEVANLATCHEPVFGFIERLSVDGAETARRAYGARGWVAHTTADLWCSTSPDAGGSTAAIWKCGAAWLSLHLWEHYRFSGDRGFLEAHYPLMRGASQFFLDHLRQDWDGWLGTYPDSSCENAYQMPSGVAAISAFGPTMSISIVRELLASTAAAAETLNVDLELRRWMHFTLQRLRPLPVNPMTGELQEWSNAEWYAAAKRTDQLPQIWALSPGTQITPISAPQLAEAAHTTLLQRRPWAQNSGGSLTAFYAIALARLGDGQTAYEVIRNHLASAVQPNFISGDASRDLELRLGGNAGLAASIAEMLLQSHAGEVHFLPALPDAWSSGSFRGLRARGGLEVDLEWHAARARRAVLRATQENRHVLRAPKGQRIASLTGSSLERLSNGCVAFDSKPGGSYIVSFA
jgi:alpha-L-fucosidase 2